MEHQTQPYHFFFFCKKQKFVSDVRRGDKFLLNEFFIAPSHRETFFQELESGMCIREREYAIYTNIGHISTEYRRQNFYCFTIIDLDIDLMLFQEADVDMVNFYCIYWKSYTDVLCKWYMFKRHIKCSKIWNIFVLMIWLSNLGNEKMKRCDVLTFLTHHSLFLWKFERLFTFSRIFLQEGHVSLTYFGTQSRVEKLCVMLTKLYISSVDIKLKLTLSRDKRIAERLFIQFQFHGNFKRTWRHLCVAPHRMLYTIMVTCLPMH